MIVLGFVSFLTDVSSEMVFALLPFFMVDVLGISMSFVGLIEGAAESVSSFLRVFSGWFSDKTGKRKPLTAWGYFVSSISKPFFALATLPVHVLTVRISDRIGKGIRTPPRDALIADSIQPEVHGKAYGFHRSMDTFGAVLGPLLAFLLLPVLGYRNIFVVSVVPGLAAVLLFLKFVREGKVRKREGSLTFRFSFKAFGFEFKLFLFIVAFFALANFSYAFFLLKAKEIGVTVYFAPLLYMVFNLTYALFAFPVGNLADRIGKKVVLGIGYMIFGLTCLGFIKAVSLVQAVFLFVLYGVFFATVDTVQRAIVPDLVSPEIRGSAFGVYHTIMGGVTLPASLIAGTLWQFYGSDLPFIFGATIGFISTILLFIFMRETR